MRYPLYGSLRDELPAPADFLIQPKDMDMGAFPNDAFGHLEYEVVGYSIVTYLLALGKGWVAFNLNDFLNFSGMKSGRVLQEMLGAKLMVLEENKYRVTVRFVARYFASVPLV